MNQTIKLTAAQARELYSVKEKFCKSKGDDCCSGNCIECYIDALKNAGFIQKTAVEEAEDIYQAFRKSYQSGEVVNFSRDEVIYKQRNAIEVLYDSLTDARKYIQSLYDNTDHCTCPAEGDCVCGQPELLNIMKKIDEVIG
jgi:hypothetical protein